MSRHFASTLFVCALSVMLGCQAATHSQVSDRSSETSTTDSNNGQGEVGDTTLVTLKVPNMT